MNSSQKKKADALAALSAIDRARLDRLAARAEVSAEAIWNEVWLYGFEDIEESVDADLEAQEDIAAGRTIPHEEVMAQARRNLESNVRREKKQAEALASLSATDHARLERLAARADVTPEAIWPDVWL